MYHQIYPELKDVRVEARMDEDGEMRLLGVEAVMEVRVILYEEEEMKILDDLYSLGQDCRIERSRRRCAGFSCRIIPSAR